MCDYYYYRPAVLEVFNLNKYYLNMKHHLYIPTYINDICNTLSNGFTENQLK